MAESLITGLVVVEADLLFLVPWERFPDCPPPLMTDRPTTVSS